MDTPNNVQDQAWYCLKSQPRHEHVAAAHLRKHAAVEVFAPMMRYQSVRGRRKVWNTEAMFPCYLFARFHLPTRAREIRSVRGVRGIVHFGSIIPPVPGELIAQLREAIGEQEVAVIPSEPVPGTEITIVDGAFSRLRVLVTHYCPARERVRVLLEMLGRGTEVEMPLSAVATDRPPHPLS